MPCTTYGAVSVADDGAWGASWNAPSASAAQQLANAFCLQSATLTCLAYSIAGKAWMSGIYCNNGSVQRGSVGMGNDPAAAIRNGFRIAVQSQIMGGNFFNVNECSLSTLIAGNGAQLQAQQALQQGTE